MRMSTELHDQSISQVLIFLQFSFVLGLLKRIPLQGYESFVFISKSYSGSQIVEELGRNMLIPDPARDRPSRPVICYPVFHVCEL